MMSLIVGFCVYMFSSSFVTNSYKVSQVQVGSLSSWCRRLCNRVYPGISSRTTTGSCFVCVCVCVCVWGGGGGGGYTQNETKNVCIMISFRATSKNCSVFIFIRQSKIAVGVKFYVMSIYWAFYPVIIFRNDLDCGSRSQQLKIDRVNRASFFADFFFFGGNKNENLWS